MTNDKRQASLDNQKWKDSQRLGTDQSGLMYYCDHCEFQCSENADCKCQLPHNTRVEKNICATAYNRMVRAFAKKQ